MAKDRAHRQPARRPAAGVCLGALLGALAALLAPGVPPAAARQAPRFDGRDFAGLDFPAPAQRADVSLAGARAWAWNNRGTNRLLLERDVRITIGAFSLLADRAAVWAEPIELGGENGEQIAVFMQNARDPAAAAGIAQQADRLLVTAVTLGSKVSLRADVLNPARPEGDPFLAEAEARLARYLDELARGPASPPPAGAGAPERPPATPGAGVLAPGRAAPAAAPAWTPPPDERGPLPPAERSPIVEPREGVVTVAGEKVELVGGGAAETGGAVAPTERAIMVTGGVVVQYQIINPVRTVQLSAERAVVFLNSTDTARVNSFDAKDVLGVYLEGDVVATDGRYTLRGSRVYYDIARERAIVLDAVFWTYDEEKGMPLYLRAEAIRQESRNQWSADKVTLANVGFAEPHFAIGATSVTLTRDQTSAGRERHYLDARGVGFLVGGVPVFGLPRVRGEFRPSVLRRMTVESEAGDPIVRTTWDLYTLLGLDSAPGNEALLLLDGYFDRGLGVGGDARWSREDLLGSAYGYFIHDNGTDRLTSGAEIDRDDDNRGMFLAEQRWRLNDQWTLFLEGSYISDETFVDAFYEQLAETRREFTNSFYARRIEDNSLFSVEARGTFNDFISNEYLLQSRGYATEKLPEVVYQRVADDLFNLLSYTSEYRYSRVDLRFSRPRLREIGFDTPARAFAGFGLAPDDSLEAARRAEGYTDDPVNRFDTRHDVEIPLAAGALNIVPFAAGRFTSWDRSFDDFSGADEDDYRLWGGGGVRLFTTIQHIDDSVDSRFFDLHRIRHLVEPNATIWSAATTIDQKDIPVYDEYVESLAAGTAARGGVRNTWQTMRGGPDAERSADWLVINSDYIWSTSEIDIESPFGRFVEARPENSFLGRFFSNEVLWNLTETIAITNDILLDTEEGDFARTTVGAIFDHGAGFGSIIEWRDLPPLDATYLDFGARYEFTRKYAAAAFATYDLNMSEIQSVGFSITRRFPQWTVGINLSYDNITDETSVGVTLRPAGLGGEDRRRIFTRDPVTTELLGDQPTPDAAPRPGRLQTGPFGEP